MIFKNQSNKDLKQKENDVTPKVFFEQNGKYFSFSRSLDVRKVNWLILLHCVQVATRCQGMLPNIHVVFTTVALMRLWI